MKTQIPLQESNPCQWNEKKLESRSLLAGPKTTPLETVQEVIPPVKHQVLQRMNIGHSDMFAATVETLQQSEYLYRSIEKQAWKTAKQQPDKTWKTPISATVKFSQDFSSLNYQELHKSGRAQKQSCTRLENIIKELQEIKKIGQGFGLKGLLWCAPHLVVRVRLTGYRPLFVHRTEPVSRKHQT